MSESDFERRRRRTEEMRGVFERRATDAPIEVRDLDGTLTFSGYAATFNAVYDVGPYQERILPTAFDRCLREQPGPDVVFNADHGRSLSGLPLARTRSARGGPGTLEISTDAQGLFFRAQLDAEDPDAQALARAVRNQTMRQCSFAFRTNRDAWTKDGTLRTLEDVTIHGGDVSAVAMPANPATSISVRAAALAAARRRIPDHTTRAVERLAVLRAKEEVGGAGGPLLTGSGVPAIRTDYYARRLEELRRAG